MHISDVELTSMNPLTVHWIKRMWFFYPFYPSIKGVTQAYLQVGLLSEMFKNNRNIMNHQHNVIKTFFAIKVIDLHFFQIVMFR